MKKLLNILLVLIFFAGSIILYWNYKNEINNESRALSYEAVVVAAGINFDDLKKIVGNSADIDRIEYARLREQFMKFQEKLAINDVRWIYTVKPDGNNFIFQVDSIPNDVFGHEDPGVIYKKPPVELYNARDNKELVVSQPYVDEYGKFISAFVPIVESNSNEIISILGLDMDYNFIRYKALINFFPNLVIVLLVWIFFIFFNFYFNLKIKIATEGKSNEEKYRQVAVEAQLAKDSLQEKTEKLEKLNKFMVGRELKMIELKKELEELKNKYENKK